MSGIQKIRLDQIKSHTVNYNHFGEQVDGMLAPYYEDFIATEGQTIFRLGANYKVDLNSLKVFLNGVYQDIGLTHAYVEVDSETIQFNQSLRAGDWVMVRIEGAGGGGVSLEHHIHRLREVPQGVIDGINKTFSVNKEIIAGTELVFQNGIMLQEGNTIDYSIVNKSITFAVAPPVGSRLLVVYIENDPEHNFK